MAPVAVVLCMQCESAAWMIRAENRADVGLVTRR